MHKEWPIVLVFTILGMTASAQTNPADTSLATYLEKNSMEIDTTIDYEELFRDFESFMDSILMPQSFFMPSLSIGRGYFNFDSKNTEMLETSAKLTYSPMLTWYQKNGIGLSLAGYIVHDGQSFNMYQFSVTPSFDYLQNRNFATGISYSRYFSKDELPFYTSPLNNEVYGYFFLRASGEV